MRFSKHRRRAVLALFAFALGATLTIYLIRHNNPPEAGSAKEPVVEFTGWSNEDGYTFANFRFANRTPNPVWVYGYLDERDPHIILRQQKDGEWHDVGVNCGTGAGVFRVRPGDDLNTRVILQGGAGFRLPLQLGIEYGLQRDHAAWKTAMSKVVHNDAKPDPERQ